MITWAMAYMIVHGIQLKGVWFMISILADFLIVGLIAEGTGKIGNK